MENIEGILLEPVGCLAEFPPLAFHEIAVRLFARKSKPSKSASRTYWHLLNLMDAREQFFARHEIDLIESLESEAAADATLYEDVLPGLAALQEMGIKLAVASSLSRAAVDTFVEKSNLAGYLSAIYSRDDANGLKSAPLMAALGAMGIDRRSVIFLADTAEGLKAAHSAGVSPILMMNDPDEAQRLSMNGVSEGRNPAGGIVSFHELPDFVRLVAAQNELISQRV